MIVLFAQENGNRGTNCKCLFQDERYYILADTVKMSIVSEMLNIKI